MTNQLTYPARVSSSQLLARILEAPDLAAQVQALPPAVLAKVIDRVGLEDAGEIVALATTEQLASVFDEDLWRNDRPGEEESFDADRFLVWLDVMLEAGDSFVAQKLSELPVDLVTLAFHRHLLVLTEDALRGELGDGSDDARAIDKALESCLTEEIDEFCLVSRNHDGWDNVLAALLALDRDHHSLVVRILERCADMDAQRIEEDGGLYEVLTSEEMLEGDVAAEREDRRAEAGHVAPAAAAAFLELARAGTDLEAATRDALTKAYFRGLASPQPMPRTPPSAPSDERDLARLLERAGVIETHAARPLLTSGKDGARNRHEPLLVRTLARLAVEEPTCFAARSEELAYLANVLAAGCSHLGRRLRPVEAVRAAIATCSLGLELASNGDAYAALVKHGADVLFRMAWARIHHDVVAVAAALDASGAKRKRKAAAPDVALALQALTDECPSMSGALAPGAAPGEARFITTRSDLEAVRAFLDEEKRARRR